MVYFPLPGKVTLVRSCRSLGEDEDDSSCYMNADVLWQGSSLHMPIIEGLCVYKLTQAWEWE